MLAPVPQTRVAHLTVESGCTQWCPLLAASCFLPIFLVKSFPPHPHLRQPEEYFCENIFHACKKTKFRFVSEAFHWKREKRLKSPFVLAQGRVSQVVGLSAQVMS